MNDFFNKKVDYFWEYEFAFGQYLKSLFQEQYVRKYSMIGNGIYNLLFVNNNIYEVTFKCGKAMVVDDGKVAARDKTKNEIVDTITHSLCENNIANTVKDGKIITFPLGKFIARCEVIKKMKEPS